MKFTILASMIRSALHTLAIILAVLLLLPAADGLRAQSSVSKPLEVEPVSLEEALEQAAREGKKILIDVYAEWCPYCQRMHGSVYTSREVLDAISDYYIWVKINVESTDKVSYYGSEMSQAQFASALENKSVPTTYFMNSEGAIIGSQPGFIESEVFADLLNFVGSDAYLTQSFEEFSMR